MRHHGKPGEIITGDITAVDVNCHYHSCQASSRSPEQISACCSSFSVAEYPWHDGFPVFSTDPLETLLASGQLRSTPKVQISGSINRDYALRQEFEASFTR